MSDKAIVLPADEARQAETEMLIGLLRKVDTAKPTKEARDELARILREHPELWRVAGDLAEQTNRRMIEVMKAPATMKMSLNTGLTQMAAELTQPGDGELEKLIIRQIVGCWLRLSFVEYSLAIGSAEGSFNMAQGAYWEKRTSAEQRRYLRAIESLARVRRLRLPAVQVNIGAQQVNQVN